MATPHGHFAERIAPKVEHLPEAAQRRLALLWTCRALREHLTRALAKKISPQLMAELRSIPADPSDLDVDLLGAQLRRLLPKFEGVMNAYMDNWDLNPFSGENAVDLATEIVEGLRLPASKSVEEASIGAVMIARFANTGKTDADQKFKDMAWRFARGGTAEEQQQIADVEAALRMNLA